jgi:hypothetical protein
MRDHCATMRLNEEVESVEGLKDGRVAANLVSKKRINADALLYAVGRQGNVERLDLSAAGIEADNRGRIKVDDEFRTAQPHIFAAGEVVGFPVWLLSRWNKGALPQPGPSVCKPMFPMKLAWPTTTRLPAGRSRVTRTAVSKSYSIAKP